MVKYIHIRELDESFNLSPFGGLTLAYSVSQELGSIFLNWAKCHPDDHFCYKSGRELAAKRLKEDGPYDILETEHPITKFLLDWVEQVLWPDLQGYRICVYLDPQANRWVSTFTESNETRI